MPSNNRLVSIYTSWDQGGILISNYDISLLQFLFCKNTVHLEECLAAFAILFCYSSNGWLQLGLRINSISSKKEMTASACFRETKYPFKHSNLQGKNAWRTTTLDPYFLYFTKSFVHLSVIAAVCYFSVYKQTYICLKSSADTLEKGVEYIRN